MSGYIEGSTYWLSPHDQGTDEWLSERDGRLTASNFGTAIGKNKWTKKEEYGALFSSGKRKEFGHTAKMHMARGTRLEPVIRDFYEQYVLDSKDGDKVEEVGLAIWKKDIRIGASVDGLIGEDGCFEAKAPMRPHGAKIPIYYEIQMQGQMAVVDRDWCDYVAYCEDADEYYIDRVYRDKKRWDEEIYPGLKAFLDQFPSPIKPSQPWISTSH